jgi:glucose-6-phosphate 1-epimerase
VTVRDAGRALTVTGEGARSTVVWNPGIERARALSDLGEVEWRHLVCVETANVRSDAVTLAPGARAALTAAVRVDTA